MTSYGNKWNPWRKVLKQRNSTAIAAVDDILRELQKSRLCNFCLVGFLQAAVLLNFNCSWCIFSVEGDSRTGALFPKVGSSAWSVNIEELPDSFLAYKSERKLQRYCRIVLLIIADRIIGRVFDIQLKQNVLYTETKKIKNHLVLSTSSYELWVANTIYKNLCMLAYKSKFRAWLNTGNFSIHSITHFIIQGTSLIIQFSDFLWEALGSVIWILTETRTTKDAFKHVPPCIELWKKFKHHFLLVRHQNDANIVIQIMLHNKKRENRPCT